MKVRSLSGGYRALGLGCIFSLFVSASLSADIRLYRYNDENGQLVISTQAPLRYARSGYEVIEPELTGDLVGRWSLDTTNRIVVVYHCRERWLDDGTRQSSPIGREERYQVLDRLENDDLMVRLDDQVVRLSRQ